MKQTKHTLTQELLQLQSWFALRREAQTVFKLYGLFCKTAGVKRLKSEMIDKI